MFLVQCSEEISNEQDTDRKTNSCWNNTRHCAEQAASASCARAVVGRPVAGIRPYRLATRPHARADMDGLCYLFLEGMGKRLGEVLADPISTALKAVNN